MLKFLPNIVSVLIIISLLLLSASNYEKQTPKQINVNDFTLLLIVMDYQSLIIC